MLPLGLSVVVRVVLTCSRYRSLAFCRNFLILSFDHRDVLLLAHAAVLICAPYIKNICISWKKCSVRCRRLSILLPWARTQYFGLSASRNLSITL